MTMPYLTPPTKHLGPPVLPYVETPMGGPGILQPFTPEIVGDLSDPTIARVVADARRVDAVRARKATVIARSRYPGPVGEMLAQTIGEWVDFGHMLGGHTLMGRLFDQLLKPAVEG